MTRNTTNTLVIIMLSIPKKLSTFTKNISKAGKMLEEVSANDENNGIIKTIAMISTALLIEKNTLKNANFLFSFVEMSDKNKKIDLIDLLAI